jgi:hypothetical protein
MKDPKAEKKNRKPGIAMIIKAVENGELLSDISRKWNIPVVPLRRMLKKEGIDYRRVILQRRTANYNKEFCKCLDFAREEGRMPSYKEFTDFGIPRSRICVYVHKLKEIGFERQFSSSSRIKDEELLNELYIIFKRTGLIPRNKDVINYSNYSVSTYVNHFGSVANAIACFQKHYAETIELNFKNKELKRK